MTKRTSRTYETPAAVLVLAVLLIAPFLGGQGEIIGAGTLSILALAAAGFLIWSWGAAGPVGLYFWIAFLAVSALSAVTSVSLHSTFAQTIYYAGCASAALVASSALRGSKWLIAAFAGIAVVGCVLGTIAGVDYLGQGGSWRVFGTFQSPGFFGGWLALIIPLTLSGFIALWPSLHRWMDDHQDVRYSWPAVALLLLSGVSLALQWAALFLTGTRVAILAAAVVSLPIIGLGFFIGVTRCRRTLVVTVLAVLLPALAFVTFARRPTVARVEGPGAAEQSHSGPFRVATWKGTLRMIEAHPLLGTGAGTFDLAFPKYRIAGPTRMAHSSYLQVASDGGVPALLILGAAFAVMAAAGLKSLRRPGGDETAFPDRYASLVLTTGIAAAVAAGLMRNIFDSDIFNAGLGFTFWIILGLFAAQAPETKESGWGIPARAALTVILVVLAAMQYTFMLGQLKYDSGETALRDGRMMDALSDYESGAAIDPLRADLWLRLGQIRGSQAFSSGYERIWQDGVADVRHAIHLEPTHAKNYIVLGRLLVEHGRTAQAVQAYREAIEVDPHALPAMLAIARLSDEAQADRMYRRILDLENTPSETLKGVPQAVTPDYAWAHHYFGNKYLKHQRWADASREFKAAVDRLERRKSYSIYVMALREIGAIDPEEEKALDKLLVDCQAGLKAAADGMREQRRNLSVWQVNYREAGEETGPAGHCA